MSTIVENKVEQNIFELNRDRVKGKWRIFLHTGKLRDSYIGISLKKTGTLNNISIAGK
jgi:hypothetical protein